MDPQQTTEPGPEFLVGLCSDLLAVREFSVAKKHALSALQSHRGLSELGQILAVADVLLAAGTHDWYSMFQVEPGNLTRPEIRTRFKELALLLNPKKNRFPFAHEAFKLVCKAWSVLSDQEEKTQYDNFVKNDNGKEKIEKGNFGNVEKLTFWAVCPYCYCLFEYEVVYEGRCLRCQNCRRGFHGVAVAAPVEGMVVEGKEEYHCVVGCFGLEYKLGGGGGDLDGKEEKSCDLDCEGGDFLGGKKGKDCSFKGCFEDVVEISDDSDNDCENGEKGSDGIGKNYGENGEKGSDEILENDGFSDEEVVNLEISSKNEKLVKNGIDGEVGNLRGSEVGNGGKRVMKNVKSVARNTKKVMGRGKKIKMVDTRGDFGTIGLDLDTKAEFGGDGISTGARNGIGDECTKDELEFFVGDDDVYVGFKSLG